MIDRFADAQVRDSMNPILADNAAELETICRRHHVRRLELFGSAAQGLYKPEHSDFDFLVEFQDMPEGSYANSYFGLHEALEELFQCSVDLVVDSAIKNPYFREAIDRTKELVYGA